MWNLLLPFALTLGGTYLATSANTKAAQQSQNAQNAIAANAQASAAPAQSYLRQVIAHSDDLTPEQQTQLQKNRLEVANQLHSSPFAGSGRTAAALFKKADSDFVNTALDQNRARAIGAADTLEGRATAADTAALAAAQTGANAGVANATVYGKAMGDIGSAIAAQQRSSQYNDRMAAIEKSLSLNSNSGTTSGSFGYN